MITSWQKSLNMEKQTPSGNLDRLEQLVGELDMNITEERAH
jgi:hypothetical protein